MMKFRRLLLFSLGVVFLLLAQCASLPQKSQKVAAYVDNDPITIGDIEYSLQIAHRREGLSKTRDVNISDYLEKVIEERLLVHEARRMGLDQHPDLMRKVDEYVLRESVSKLYQEEILDYITVDEQDIRDYFYEEYEQYVISSIETYSSEDAGLIAMELKQGKDFKILAREFALHDTRNGVEEATFFRNDLSQSLREVIDKLNPGEESGVFEAGSRFYLLKLLDRRKADDAMLEEKRGDIEQAIHKGMVDQRSAEYLEFLKREMNPEIYEEVLSSIPEELEGQERKTWLQDNRPIVTLRDSTLSVGQLVKAMRPGSTWNRDVIVKKWLDRRVVDYEALDRQYHINSELKDMVSRYKNKMLLRFFVKNMLYPEVEISDEDLLEYYENNRDEFSIPEKFKVQQITFQAEPEAQEVRKELLQGADFSWMARNRSLDNYAQDGGIVGWQLKRQFPADLGDIMGDLEPGDFTEVIQSGDFYRIYRLLDKTGPVVDDFESVRPAVRKRVFRVKYDKLRDSYVERLKGEAEITVDDETVQELDRMIRSRSST